MAKFSKGQSGNPGGRPKGLGDIREIARKHTPEAIETLVTVMHNASATDQARVHAATALLDRAWGRPAQTIHASVERNAEIDSSLERDLSELLGKVISERPENTRPTGAAPVVDGAADGDAPASGVTH